MTNQDYLNLLTSAFRDKVKFTATVSLRVSAYTQVQSLLESMIQKFDLDNAVGSQLDVIGQWVGVSREIRTPVVGVYFTWDSTFDVGWDYGVWQDPTQPDAITSLPDDVYRTLIKATIAANRWDGTTTNAYEVWQIVFQNIFMIIVDHQDMSYDLGFVGGIVDSLTLALLTGGYIKLKPEGVKINNFLIPVNDGPLFAWDSDTDFLKGWDIGSWPREVAPT